MSRRLQQLQGFENVYAPFSGVVTARNTDTGDLITGGVNSGSTAKSLFHLDDIAQLRVFVSVPEIYSGQIHTGSTATLTLDEYPGQVFTGTIARNASAIDPASRTLNVEVDIPNPGDKLLPGAYVNVHFNMPSGGGNLSIPSNAVIFRSRAPRSRSHATGTSSSYPSRSPPITAPPSKSIPASPAPIRSSWTQSDSIANGQPVKVGAGKLSAGPFKFALRFVSPQADLLLSLRGKPPLWTLLFAALPRHRLQGRPEIRQAHNPHLPGAGRLR